MEKQTFTQKLTGDKLAASEWNQLTNYVNEVADEIINNSGSELEENLVNSTLHPTANEEKNILSVRLNSYFTFDLTYTLAGNLQNPVTQEQIDTFRSLNNNILVDSFDIGYLELSVIQGIMNERGAITPADITDLANTTTYERQHGQTSLSNLGAELSSLPNERFFKLICSDGILLGLKISGDIIFNGTNYGIDKLSEIMLVASNLFPTILENPDAITLVVDNTKGMYRSGINGIYSSRCEYTTLINLSGQSFGGTPISLEDFLSFDSLQYWETNLHIPLYDMSYMDKDTFRELNGGGGLYNSTFVGYDCNSYDLLRMMEPYIDYYDDLTGDQIAPYQLLSQVESLLRSTDLDLRIFGIKLQENKVILFEVHKPDFKFKLEYGLLWISDVMKLVDYFKSGAGVNLGPWAPSL